MGKGLCWRRMETHIPFWTRKLEQAGKKGGRHVVAVVARRAWRQGERAACMLRLCSCPRPRPSFAACRRPGAPAPAPAAAAVANHHHHLKHQRTMQQGASGSSRQEQQTAAVGQGQDARPLLSVAPMWV